MGQQLSRCMLNAPSAAQRSLRWTTTEPVRASVAGAVEQSVPARADRRGCW